MKGFKILTAGFLILSAASFAQSIYMAGIFPTIDHSADLSNKWGTTCS